jgi:hypothetical protein
MKFILDSDKEALEDRYQGLDIRIVFSCDSSKVEVA